MFFKYLTASFFVQDIKRASVDDNLGIVWSIVEDFFVSDDSSSTDVLLRQRFSVFASLTCSVMASPTKIVAICGVVFAFHTIALSVVMGPVLGLFG